MRFEYGNFGGTKIQLQEKSLKSLVDTPQAEHEHDLIRFGLRR